MNYTVTVLYSSRARMHARTHTHAILGQNEPNCRMVDGGLFMYYLASTSDVLAVLCIHQTSHLKARVTAIANSSSLLLLTLFYNRYFILPVEHCGLLFYFTVRGVKIQKQQQQEQKQQRRR